MPGKKNVMEAIFSVVFCGFISLPVLTGSWLTDPDLAAEGRRAATRPELALVWDDPTAFATAWERYVNDRLRWRQALIEWHGRFKYFVLGVSASPDVVLGEQGWLYWAQKGDGNPLAHFRGLEVQRADELAEVTSILQARSDWLAARGVTYAFLIAPNKETIYPEFMPPAQVRLREGSLMDRFVEYARQHSTVNIVDPRQRLLEAKRHRVTYHPTDTHWNAYGAYAAYLALVEALRSQHPSIVPVALSTQDFVEVAGAWAYAIPAHGAEPHGGDEPVSGDLAGVLGLRRILRDASVVPRTPLAPCARVVPTVARPSGWEDVEDGPHDSLGHAGLLTTVCDGKPLHLLVMHDSFGPLFVPYLSETFGRVTYAWADDFTFAQGVVEETDVDIVIQVHVERHVLPSFIY